MTLTLALLVAALGPAADEPARFAVTTRKPADAVAVGGDAARTVFEVRSTSGIGGATVERRTDGWPAAVVVKLHLTGLEQFTVTAGGETLRVSVLARAGGPQVLRSKGKDETPVGEKDPLWVGVRAVGPDGKPAATVPLKDGHFEVTLPKALFAGNPKAVTLDWVDWFRR